MKNNKEEKNINTHNPKNIKYKLIKKTESKKNSISLSYNDLPTVNSISKNLIKNKSNKNNKLSKYSNINEQTSKLNKTTIYENDNNNKESHSIRYNKNKNVSKNDNKYTSSFYLDEEKNIMNKTFHGKSFYNKSTKGEEIKKNENHLQDLPLSTRNNFNSKKEDYKRALSKKRTEKEIQNKINKMNKNSFGKVNKYEKKSKNYISNNKSIIK